MVEPTEELKDEIDRIAEEGYGPPIEAKSIHQRMLAILAELPAIGKDQRNTQQNFMYRGHDDVMNALNPLLAKHGVFFVPDVIERIPAERTTGKGTTMYEVNLHVRFTFYGAAGDTLVASAWGEGTDMGDKSTNKAMTMALKNVLAQSFALATEELSDADAGTPEETRRGGGAPAQPRSQGEGQQRQRREKPFDPGKEFLPDAPRGEHYWDRVAERQNHLEPSLDWRSIIEDVLRQGWGVSTLGEMHEDARREFMVRYANALTKAGEKMTDGDFPPISDDELKAAFAWAFDGMEIEIPKAEAALTEKQQASLDEEAAQAAAADA